MALDYITNSIAKRNAEIFEGLKRTDPILLDEWAIAVRRRIYALARSAQPGSPYLDPPDIKDRWDKGKFWVVYRGEEHWGQKPSRIKRRQKEHLVKYSSSQSRTVDIYGIAPNAGGVRGARAPEKQYTPSKPYTAYFGGKFIRMHKKQVVSSSVGIPLKQAYYNGSPITPYGYYSVYGIIFGKAEIFGSYFGASVWAADSYADWLVKNRGNEIENIIEEELQIVMEKYFITPDSLTSKAIS